MIRHPQQNILALTAAVALSVTALTASCPTAARSQASDPVGVLESVVPGLKGATSQTAAARTAASASVLTTTSPSYQITDLGSLGGGISSGSGVNDFGQVVGFSTYSPSSPNVNAFLWQGGFTNLGTLGGANSTAAGINEFGQAAGASDTASGGQHAFVWTSASGLRDLGTLGGVSSAAFGINTVNVPVLLSQGTILTQAVGSSRTDAGTQHAFLWDSIDGLQDLGTLGGSSSAAFAINDLGQVVGSSSVASGATHAFLWDSAAGLQDLGTLGGRTSAAYAINELGQVVGVSRISTSSPASHAFLWSSTGGLQDLGTLGGNNSTAFGISVPGQVVGYSILSDGITEHAFVWSSASGIQDLNDLIPAGSGWTLNQATGISILDGKITGTGILNGQTHAFLLTPVY